MSVLLVGRRELALVLAVTTAWLGGSTSASAKELCVDAATGSDDHGYAANDGASNCWASIGRAAWGSTNRAAPVGAEAAGAGDTVTIAAGTYLFSGTLGHRWEVVYNPVNSGAAGQPITFVASGVVTLQAPTTASPVIGCAGRDHVVWRGPFLLDEAAISISPDTGTVVMNDAVGCGVDGISVDGNGAPVYVDNHNGVRIEGCQGCFVRNATLHDIYHAGGNWNGAGVMLYNSIDTLIEHNHIYNVGSGVFVKGVFATQVAQSRSVIRFNLTEHADAVCYMTQDSADARVYQNVCRDSGIGLIAQARDVAPTEHPVRDVFANNTVVASAQACIMVRGNSHEQVQVWNNICSVAPVAVYVDGGVTLAESQVDFEHQVYATTRLATDAVGNYTLASWTSTYGHEAAAPAAIEADPRFVDGATGDYRLCTGAGLPAAGCVVASPALGHGVDLLDLDEDGDRADLIPAGAYLSGLELIGPGAGPGGVCGDGMVDPGELCDGASCPSTCDDGEACTTDALTGSAAACSATCVRTAISACVGGDGCCPSGCAADFDDDCAGGGNGEGDGAAGCGCAAEGGAAGAGWLLGLAALLPGRRRRRAVGSGARTRW